MDYNKMGILREAFPNIPFLGLTATITPTGISYFFKSTKFKRPAIIRQTVRRKNVDIWVAQINGQEYDDLCVLFPDNISKPQNIPQTIIFYNGRVGCVRMAKWLRSRLSASLRSEDETVVRSYSGVLDETSKQETLELLRNNACRIVVCTDAFGLGLNIPAIPRVVVWKLYSKLGIDGLHQRIGRAGRDTDERALALIFVSKANLSGQYASLMKKVADMGDETTTRKKTKQTGKTKPVSLTEIQSSVPNDDDVFSYTLSVSKETESNFRKALPDIYAGPTKKAQASSSESNLTVGLHWVVQTEGCREQPFLVAFDDPEMMERCGGCDRCRMRHLNETGAVDSPPTLHGISFTITVAYRAYMQTSTDKPRKKRKHAKQTISEDRMDKLISDIKTWRQEALNGLVSRFAELTVQIVFPDKRIVAIADKTKNIGSKEDLIGALQECGYAFPESVIFSYTEDLYRCISDSLKDNHPPSQLKEQFDRAANPVVKQRYSTESEAVQPVSAIRQSTQSTSSIPLHLQRAPIPTIVKPIPQNTPAPRIPNWPIPSIVPSNPPIFPIQKRVPLVEKHVSNSDVINVPVDQVLLSPYNTRRSAARQSLAKQLSTVSTTSFNAVNDREVILSKGNKLRKHDQPDKENCVRSISAGKRRKLTQT